MNHIKTCSYCRNDSQSTKPTIRIKGASSYRKERKLSELASVIKGTSYSNISYPESFRKTKTKAASSISSVDKSQKLKELGRLIRGV